MNQYTFLYFNYLISFKENNAVMMNLQCRKIFGVTVLLQKQERIHRSSIDSTIDLIMFAIKHSNSWRRKKGFTPSVGYGTVLMQHCNTLTNTFLTSIGRVRVADSWFNSITNEPSNVNSMKGKLTDEAL